MAVTDIAISLLLVLPIAGFALTALVGPRLGGQAFWIPVLAIVTTWAIGMFVVWSVLTGQPPFGAEHVHRFSIYTWIPAGDFQVPFSLAVDNLTAALLIVVCTVGMLEIGRAHV